MIRHRLNGEALEVLAALPAKKVRVRYEDGFVGETHLRMLVADGGREEVEQAIAGVSQEAAVSGRRA